MLRKNKQLSRTYLCAYLAWLFGCWIPPLLVSRDSGALAIVLVVLDCLIVAALITSHVFKNLNKNKLFFMISIPSLVLVVLLSILGLVLEGVFTAQGQPAPWPWIAGGFSTLMSILVCLFYYFGAHSFLKPEEKI